MKTHFPAAALAGLPGMPGTVSGVIKMAKREGWRWQAHAGRGGGRDYHPDDLPAATQQQLRHRAVVVASSDRDSALRHAQDGTRDSENTPIPSQPSPLLARDLGPKAPRLRNDGRVWNPNTRKIVSNHGGKGNMGNEARQPADWAREPWVAALRLECRRVKSQAKVAARLNYLRRRGDRPGRR